MKLYIIALIMIMGICCAHPYNDYNDDTQTSYQDTEYDWLSDNMMFTGYSTWDYPINYHVPHYDMMYHTYYPDYMNNWYSYFYSNNNYWLNDYSSYGYYPYTIFGYHRTFYYWDI